MSEQLRRVPRDMFQFAVHDELYLAIMQVFGEANERLETALTFDQVLAGLDDAGWYDPVADDKLDRALAQLCEWKLLDRVQNHGAHYATAEEYERKNLQYSLTKRGEAAFEGVQQALYLLTSSGALQTAVLDAIADHLDDLYALLRDDNSANRRIYSTLAGLEGHLDALRGNIKQFNNELQRLLRDDAADLSTFDEVKRATVTYLEEFVTDLDQRKRTIAAAVTRVEEVGVSVLHDRALAGADLPALPGSDPRPRWLAGRQAKWDGLRRWFLPVDGSAPAVDTLRDIARRAILSLLRVLERFGEARRGTASTAADFRILARWFAACESEDDAHRLWGVAFGMWPARHAHLALDEPETVSGAPPWAEAPRVPVSPLLRTHGQTEKISRAARVRDTRQLRRRRRERAIRERAELEAAWEGLKTYDTVRLSSFGRLEHESFGRLLQLLGRALGARPDSSGARRAVTADGRLEVVLTDPEDDREATLTTPKGRFTGPDYAVRIRSPVEGPTAESTALRAGPPAARAEGAATR